MADIGTTLRETRMRARIDITEVERATKIRARYLRAIENEEWDALPGPVYVKSFLRTYSDYLGLDSRALVDDYKRRYERPSDEGRSIAALHRERERAARGPLIPAWALIGLVLVAIVVVLWLIGSGGGSKKPAQHASTRKSLPTKPAPHRHRRHHRARPTTVRLQLVPTGQVYVCLVDGTGKRLIPGQIFAAGQTIPVKRAPKLLLTLGNASVRMTVNGKVHPVASSATSIGYELTPTAARSLPVSQQPKCT